MKILFLSVLLGVLSVQAGEYNWSIAGRASSNMLITVQSLEPHTYLPVCGIDLTNATLVEATFTEQSSGISMVVTGSVADASTGKMSFTWDPRSSRYERDFTYSIVAKNGGTTLFTGTGEVKFAAQYTFDWSRIRNLNSTNSPFATDSESSANLEYATNLAITMDAEASGRLVATSSADRAYSDGLDAATRLVVASTGQQAAAYTDAKSVSDREYADNQDNAHSVLDRNYADQAASLSSGRVWSVNGQTGDVTVADNLDWTNYPGYFLSNTYYVVNVVTGAASGYATNGWGITVTNPVVSGMDYNVTNGLAPTGYVTEVVGEYAKTNHDHSGVYQPSGTYLVPSDTNGLASTNYVASAVSGKVDAVTLGSAAYSSNEAFATAAQGAKADSAVQYNALGELDITSHYLRSGPNDDKWTMYFSGNNLKLKHDFGDPPQQYFYDVLSTYNFSAGTHYLAPSGNGSALTGITAAQVGALASNGVAVSSAYATNAGTATTALGGWPADDLGWTNAANITSGLLPWGRVATNYTANGVLTIDANSNRAWTAQGSLSVGTASVANAGWPTTLWATNTAAGIAAAGGLTNISKDGTPASVTNGIATLNSSTMNATALTVVNGTATVAQFLNTLTMPSNTVIAVSNGVSAFFLFWTNSTYSITFPTETFTNTSGTTFTTNTSYTTYWIKSPFDTIFKGGGR